MSGITSFVDSVPVYDDYVYYADWLKEFDGDYDTFIEWAEENELTGTDC